MSDNTSQGGLDLMTSDEITELNGVADGSGAKAQRIKVGFGPDSKLKDVHEAQGLPIDSAESAMATITIGPGTTVGQTPAASTPIDTSGYSWLSLHVLPGYVGQTGLTLQGSNDGTNWVTVALSTASATSSGLTTSMGITNQVFNGPIPTRFIRFVAAGAYTSGSQTLLLYMQALPGVLQSQGTNTNISAVGGNQMPAIANAPLTIGTSTQNGFEERQSSSADQVATAIRAAVSGQFIYVTGIHVSTWGSGATPRQVRLVAAASALIEQQVICPANDSRSRVFRNPWKIASASNIALNCVVTSIGAAAGNWEVVVEGYFQSS